MSNENEYTLADSNLSVPGVPQDSPSLPAPTDKAVIQAYQARGYALAMRVLQSDLYRMLDDRERAECDELIRLGQGAPELAAPAGECGPACFNYGTGLVCEYCTSPAPAQVPEPSSAVKADEELHEFKLRLSEYGVAMAHRQGEKARVLADVLSSMVEEAKALADSEGSRAVTYLRRARTAERELAAVRAALAAASEPRAPVLTYIQRLYLDQAQHELETRALDQHEKGNSSTAKGCEASAYVIRQMLAAAHTATDPQRSAP